MPDPNDPSVFTLCVTSQRYPASELAELMKALNQTVAGFKGGRMLVEFSLAGSYQTPGAPQPRLDQAAVLEATGYPLATAAPLQTAPDHPRPDAAPDGDDAILEPAPHRLTTLDGLEPSIAKLPLSAFSRRAAGALQAAGLYTVEDLLMLSAEELIELVPGFGRAMALDLITFLAAQGVELAPLVLPHPEEIFGEQDDSIVELGLDQELIERLDGWGLSRIVDLLPLWSGAFPEDVTLTEVGQIKAALYRRGFLLSRNRSIKPMFTNPAEEVLSGGDEPHSLASALLAERPDVGEVSFLELLHNDQLTPHVKNRLSRSGLKQIRDLAGLTRLDIMKLTGLGEKALDELEQTLAELKLKLVE